MNIIVFEDLGVENPYPFTTGCSAYAITSASLRLVNFLKSLNSRMAGIVPHAPTIKNWENISALTEASDQLRLEAIVNTQKRIFFRRNVTQRPNDIELILDMYQNTQYEQSDGLSTAPISL
jgi:hypothetical protein